MPVGAAAIPWIIGGLGAASSVAGGLRNREKTTTSSNTFKRILRPEQETAIATLMDRARTMTTDPGAGLEPLRSEAMGGVNAGYTGLLDRLKKSLLARGVRTPEGSVPGMMLQSGLSRLGDLAKVGNTFAGMKLEQQRYGDSLLQRLLGEDFQHEGTGKQTTPGDVAGGALGGGLSTLLGLLALTRGGNSWGDD